MNLWQLPTRLKLGEEDYEIRADFRDILEIFSYFQDESLPAFIRWKIALRLFYCRPIPKELEQVAMEEMNRFISYGKDPSPGPALIHWQKDADLILADVNRTAGQEIRSLSFVHWWTFLSWFHGIGEGQLSAVVALRDKLRRGAKLEDWEKEFYQKNKARIDLPRDEDPQTRAEKARLQALLAQ